MEFRRTLHDLYALYFLPEVIVKLFMRWVTGHFVILIEIALHVSMCISAHRFILFSGVEIFV